MSRTAKTTAIVLPFPRVPSPTASVFPAPVAPTAGQQPISPAVAIWLDVFTDAIVTMVLREAQHG
jgi:hypothetical protein